MKKILIATKETKSLGLHQVISTLNTDECNIESKIYYDGKIYKKETYYHETQEINNISWERERKYYTENNYTIIVI